MAQADRPRWQPVYIGLGSNVGDSPALIEQAIVLLAGLERTRLMCRSPLYRSQPWGPVAQAEFCNAAAGFVSELDPERWLQALQGIETALGRTRSELRWGPREIDLDLLAHGTRVSQTDQLSLPHPGIPEREFVLYPLRDIAEDLCLPWGRVRELAARVAPRGIQRWS